MLMPLEIQKHSFAKAKMGGYQTSAVDSFMVELTADYTTLYKENATLKAKLKVLVDKMEEYRATEDAMRTALLTAQRMATAMVEEAEQKKTVLLAEAEQEAKRQVAALLEQIALEEQRLAAAKQETASFLSQIHQVSTQHLHLLEQLAEHYDLPAVAEEPIQEPEAPVEPEVEVPQEDIVSMDTADLPPFTAMDFTALDALMEEDGENSFHLSDFADLSDCSAVEEPIEEETVPTETAEAVPFADPFAEAESVVESDPFAELSTAIPTEMAEESENPVAVPAMAEEKSFSPFQSSLQGEDSLYTRRFNLEDLQFGRNYHK